MVFRKIKDAFGNKGVSEDSGEDYVEIDLGQGEKESKVAVKLFELKKYDDVNRILNALREGYTIALIDIKNLKQKDSIELKRAISKIKKTVDALEGKVAGHDNMVIATPSFAKIYKDVDESKNQNQKKKDFETY